MAETKTSTSNLEAYCVRCREKRAIQDATPVFTEKGQPATRGQCPVCGTTLFRMGSTPAHEHLTAPPASKADGKLVIVESPAKARTVGRFLGRGYTVRASVGHVRDLLRSTLSVDVENDFQPTYRVLNEKRQVVKELQAEVKKASEVYLATDPDREGEAIAWHLMEAVKIRPGQARRVVFHEITQSAIEEAFAHPSKINMHLVNAQQARRVLDRLVGYSLSPLLWRKVRGRLSAGRVQSVAVRLVVEREREIQAFVPQEYWSIAAELAKREERRTPRTFIARLHRINGQEVDLRDQPATQAVVDVLERSVYVVSSVKEGQRKRQPSPPFITSTMQQEASRRLGFTASRTMRIAQQLYEGIELPGEGSVGLITYMRTDSTNVAEQAQAEARAYIAQRFGEKFLPARPPVYRTRAKGAQEAHEAIRPTSVRREPEAIKDHLSRDQYRLYQLVWQRFLASQMQPAVYDTVTVEVEAGPDGASPRPYLFRATGATLRFPGFLAVYEEARDEDATEEEPAQQIPPLTVNELLNLVRLIPEQHFTQPPPRYTEASLVRALEEYGIGRPSTYAPIISTIQQRGYVQRDGKRLTPTETGFLVNDLLVENFPVVLDYGFTAQMEQNLDEIAAGRREWVPVVREFYVPFQESLVAAEQSIEKVDMGPQEIGRNCPECGAPLIVRWGRYGKFIGCRRFPDCRYTEPWLEKVGVTCPQCGGELVEKRTRKGRTGYGCANYPACNFWVWQRPVPQRCPACGGLMTLGRKDTARCTACGTEVPLEEPAEEAVPAGL
jgi:DNA topoisomerase-1